MLISEGSKQQVCSECSNTNLFLDPVKGELICEQCGIVVSGEQLSMKPEWRAFDFSQRENLPRTGSPLDLTIHDRGLSSTIGWSNRDYAGRPLNPEMRYRLYRLRKWNRRSQISNSRNRNLSQALSLMHKLSDELNLPRSVLENGSMIYRNALKANYVRGRSILGIVVAALYMACRQCAVLRSLTDFAEAAEVPRKTTAKSYRFLHQKLKLNIPRVQQSSYIKRLVSRLRLRGYTEMLAMRLLEEAINNNFTNGRSSAGIAAACIYMSGRIMDEGLTQYRVAHEAQVSEVTIRNRYKELLRNFDIVIYV